MTRTTPMIARLVASGLIGCAMLAGPSFAADKSPSMAGEHVGHQAKPASTGKSAPAHQTLEQAMKAGMDAMHNMPMSGDVDKDFAAMMKHHHEQAVAMAQIELRDGKSPELKAMARKMIKDQKKEIDMLGAWLKKHP